MTKRLPNRRRTGAVLLIVVVLVLLMSLAAYNYLLSMQTENLAARATGDRLTARQAACSARDLVMVLLEKSRSERDALGGLRDNPDVFAGFRLLDVEASEDEFIPRGMVVHKNDQAATDVPLRFGAVNESAKLHLLKLVEWDLLEPGAGRAALMLLPGMDEPTADALLDWVDPDSEPRLQGAEADRYAMAMMPVPPRNAMPFDMEELLHVPGVDAHRMWGLPLAMAGIDEGPPAATPGRFGDQAARPWRDFLTIYSGERNESRDGIPRVHINDSRLDDVHQRLLAVMPVEWANFIVLWRQYGPGVTTSETREAGQMTIDYSLPASYLIEHPLDLLGTTVTLTGSQPSVSVNSPFSTEPLVMQSQLPELFDLVTVFPEQRIVGRVNVNLAPRSVLQGVPGIDEAMAERIVAARTMGGDSMDGRDHAVWLLTEGIVSLATMRELEPNLTAGGDVYSAEFWGYVDDRSAGFRFEATIDASVSRPRQVYYRELAAKKPSFMTPDTYTNAVGSGAGYRPDYARRGGP